MEDLQSAASVLASTIAELNDLISGEGELPEGYSLDYYKQCLLREIREARKAFDDEWSKAFPPMID